MGTNATKQTLKTPTSREFDSFIAALPQTSTFIGFAKKITSFNMDESNTSLEISGIGLVEYSKSSDFGARTYTLKLLDNSISAYHRQEYSHPENRFSFNGRETWQGPEECREWLKSTLSKLGLTKDEFIDFVIALDTSASAYLHGLSVHLRNFDL